MIKLNITEIDDKIFIDNACRIHYKSKKCKSCKKWKQHNNKIGKIYKNNGKINSKTLKLVSKLSNKCDKCSSNNPKKCNSRIISFVKFQLCFFNIFTYCSKCENKCDDQHKVKVIAMVFFSISIF